ncbi:hypothetical protein D3C81_2263930 [compost metagenome]
MVGVNTDVAGDGQGFLHDFAGAHFGIFQQRAGGRLGIRATGADRNQIIFRLDYVTVTGDDQRGILIGYRQQGFQLA